MRLSLGSKGCLSAALNGSICYALQADVASIAAFAVDSQSSFFEVA